MPHRGTADPIMRSAPFSRPEPIIGTTPLEPLPDAPGYDPEGGFMARVAELR